jgi:hypothetical protein
MFPMAESIQITSACMPDIARQKLGWWTHAAPGLNEAQWGARQMAPLPDQTAVLDRRARFVDTVADEQNPTTRASPLMHHQD